MELNHPLRVVTPTLDGDILRILALAETEFTPPEIHRLIGEHSVAGIRKGLERLVTQGIVQQRAAGKGSLYQLNRDHLAAPAVIELTRMKEELLSRMRRELTEWEIHSAYAALFGSAARNDMRPDSDIDVLLVRPQGVEADDDVWSKQLYELADTVRRWTGNSTSVLEFGADQIDEAAGDGDPVLVTIGEEGIRVQGPSSYLRRRLAGMRI
jgi:predicted nucleotidyltransferase